jgi:hypothetical protein
MAMKQLRVQFLFEVSDLQAEGRLRQTEMPRCAREAAAVGNLQEVSQLF